jgi:hypothetical protein
MSTVKFDKWLNGDGTPRQTVMQVVQAVKTDTFSGSSSDAWIDTAFSATLTPKDANSRILIQMTLMAASSYWELAGKFQRQIGAGSWVDVGTGNRGAQTNANQAAGFTHSHYMNSYYSFWYPCSYTFLDTPKTTSAVTYKLFLQPHSTNTVYINRTKDDNNSADYHGCPISTITLMEISG